MGEVQAHRTTPSAAVQGPRYEMSGRVDCAGQGAGHRIWVLCGHSGLAGNAACQPGSLFPLHGILFLGEELTLLGLAVLILPAGCWDACCVGNSFLWSFSSN